MNNPAAAFIKILEIELEDLEDDIQLIMADSEVRRNHREITDYVYRENLALLKKEIFDVDGIRHKLKQLDPADFGTPEEVINLLLKELRDKVKRQIVPPVLLTMVERKFEKVNRYVTESDICN
ncbi:MAG: hypothetical protein JXA95_07710 [Spirochaetales bacterium]|nr:hypothetical protein [Spirochaetales bacterium]